MRSDLAEAMGRRSENGVALIITLIMLAVTLVMAVAFLALSKRERNAVSTSTDTTTARLADDSALAAAQAQIIANILATNTSAYDSRLLVSTNFQNSYGFVPNIANVTNVNYDYLANGGALTADDLIQNIANLELMPRAPVYVNTNNGSPLDFRFYLDLNRNGRDEANNNVTNYDINGDIILDGGSPLVNQQIGDPEWIGVLEHPGQPHGPNNRFVARYAFFAQPVGNSLDLNYIHNQTLNTSLGNSDGYFRNEGVGSWELNLAAFLSDLNTNQWLPAIAPDNAYYAYNEPFGSPNAGRAFDDARALLSWRYNGNYTSLAVPPIYFQDGLYNAGIDGYSFGNLMTYSYLPLVTIPGIKNWAGSENINSFFSLPSDLFDGTKNLGNFPNRLAAAGNGVSTYDRYTLYRMLDQLGTGSTVDEGKINLNYSNAVVQYDNSGVVTNITVIPGAETNMVPWAPLDFFNAAADRMLRHYTAEWFAANPTNYLATYYGWTNFPNYISQAGLGLTNFPYFGMTNQVPVIGITNIPVYIDGRFVYSAAINRVLQLAANLYDASTNKTSRLGKDYPSVFRPMFSTAVSANNVNDRNVYISGFRDESVLNPLTVGVTPPLDAPLDVTATTLTPNATYNQANGNIYGVPWIIGARKGFPGFDQFFMLNVFQLTRKLQVSRPSTSYQGATGTNQLFTISVTNRLGYSFWNSYDTNYAPASGNVQVYMRDDINMGLSNGVTGAQISSFYGNPPVVEFTFTTNMSYWQGSGWILGNPPGTIPTYQKPLTSSFVSGEWDFAFLPESIFTPTTGAIYPQGSSEWNNGTQPVPFPQMLLTTTNRIQAVILDGNHVIDYVQLRGPSGVRNLSSEVADSPLNTTDLKAMTEGTAMWDTNLFTVGGPTKGVVNQIEVSRFNPSGTVSTFWKKPPNMPSSLNTPAAEADYFNAFFVGGPFVFNGKIYYNTNLIIQAPYTPTRTAWQYTSWQANDPLVHYLADDLNTITKQTGLHHADITANTDYPTPNLNTIGVRYQPWGLNAQMSQAGSVSGVQADANAYNLSYRDPLVWRSDSWDFPAGKYPSVGWLGRVHRGTPWQTIYLKSPNVLSTTSALGATTNNIGTNTWALWTGDTQTVTHQGITSYYDAANSAPVQDDDLFDLFTAQLNDNAVHGTLSVNQDGLAAWSAVLSGVVALTNSAAYPLAGDPVAYTNMIIQPAGLAGTNSALGQIVDGPDGINSTRNNFLNVDGVKGAFENVGDILRVPALSTHSPLLNWNNQNQQQNGISDELYEWLPQQILGLLHGSASRYVIYCYGQTLQPAVNGTVLSGTYFNMVTNYQVTAESAARAVIRVERHATATGTNYNTVIESYNQLPPD